MMMANLLAETLALLKFHGLTPVDVRWVGGRPATWGEPKSSFLGSWKDFAALADFEYDAGYGGEEINTNLKVVGGDWWLERHEYDGSEWWEFKRLPSQPVDAEPMRAEDLREH